MSWRSGQRRDRPRQGHPRQILNKFTCSYNGKEVDPDRSASGDRRQPVHRLLRDAEEPARSTSCGPTMTARFHQGNHRHLSRSHEAPESLRIAGLGAAALVFRRDGRRRAVVGWRQRNAGALNWRRSPPLPAGGFKSQPVTQFEREGKKSGFLFATPETQAMQQDDGDESRLPVGRAWRRSCGRQARGRRRKSCASCHGAAARCAASARPTRRSARTPASCSTLEHQINYCRTERMQAPALEWETQDMLGISTFVMYQSRGLPVNVAVDGPAKPFSRGRRALSHAPRPVERRLHPLP